MFRIICDPSSGNIERAWLKLLVIFLCALSVFGSVIFGPVVCVPGATRRTRHTHHREKTVAQNIVEEIKQYQNKWLQHVQRMDTNRIPKQALQYRPKGRRKIGRPRKRWRDQLHFEDQGTGNTPNPSGTWWWWWIYDLFVSLYISTIPSFYKLPT